ncbi:MAG: CHAT domain-containing protein [Desulfobacterales bacterium]|nr:CHAT domain-containing protein [Desulfobacterales bacterium]
MKAKHIVILTFTCIFLAVVPLATSHAAENSEISHLISEGEIFFNQGRFDQAVQVWEKAMNFPDIKHNPGVYLDTVAHLVHAYQALGFHERALDALINAMPVVEKSDNRKRNAVFFSSLADVYLTLGNLKKAVKYIRKAVEQAEKSGDPTVLADVFNNAGNMCVMDGNYKDAVQAYGKSYALLDALEKTDELKTKILVNKACAEFRFNHVRAMFTTLEQALQHIRTMPGSYAKAENLIALGVLISKVKAREPEQGNPLSDNDLPRLSYRLLNEAKQIGRDIENPRIISEASGYLGQLYEKENQYKEALGLTRSAIFFAHQAGCPEILYLWQWQLARLLRAQGKTEQAARVCQEAIKTLNPIRLELFRGYRAQRDTFDENIRPVYLELADLYIEQAEAMQDRISREQKLRQARDTMELLKSAELQNFYKDECVTAAQGKKISLDRPPARTAVVYPISLADRLVVLLNLPDSLIHFSAPVGSGELHETAKLFRKQLQTRSSYIFRRNGRKMYNWLIRPAEAELAASQIDTLVIAPDGPLRLIPFSALENGDHFLVEKYSVATVPAIRLTVPGNEEPEHAEILLTGLSEAVQEFTPLPGVKDELFDVKAIMNARSLLFNNDFTIPKLTGEFKANPYSILHMATHGVFGGNAKESFLLTYESRLDMDILENLIRLGSFRDRKVELLTLSACQTAMGSERAALGLAGVAVKAGVRSAIATLWFVDDEATSLVIREFYRQMKTQGMSKAGALQNAQKKMIAQRRFWHPIYWAPFLLIGNWM